MIHRENRPTIHETAVHCASKTTAPEMNPEANHGVSREWKGVRND